jgi:hypothetical protein
MNKLSINHQVCIQQQVNGMLQLLDANRNNQSMTIGELPDLRPSAPAIAIS